MTGSSLLHNYLEALKANRDNLLVLLFILVYIVQTAFSLPCATS
jgi:hypothetical protein